VVHRRAFQVVNFYILFWDVTRKFFFVFVSIGDIKFTPIKKGKKDKQEMYRLLDGKGNDFNNR
jgi:hypothetical protein